MRPSSHNGQPSDEGTRRTLHQTSPFVAEKRELLLRCLPRSHSKCSARCVQDDSIYIDSSSNGHDFQDIWPPYASRLDSFGAHYQIIPQSADASLICDDLAHCSSKCTGPPRHCSGHVRAPVRGFNVWDQLPCKKIASLGLRKTHI